MSVGLWLIAYALGVGTLGLVGVRRAHWLTRAPRLGAGVVLAAAWSVPLALMLAGITLALPASALTVDLGALLGACLTRLRAAYGTAEGTSMVTAGQLLTLAVLVRLVWASALLAGRRRSAWRRHRLLLRLSRQPRPDVAAVVLDCPGPAAYSVAGRRGTVVVTSGAVELLTPPELEAVLAHEDAHLRRRHHRRQLSAALLAAALPIVPLLRHTPAQVGRLLEMDADERAADRHERQVLASALVAITTGAIRPSRAPATSAALASRRAAGSDAAARVRRLLTPPAGLTRRGRTATAGAAVALTAVPILLAAAPALVALH